MLVVYLCIFFGIPYFSHEHKVINTWIKLTVKFLFDNDFKGVISDLKIEYF
jgi:hypothetical protein